MYVDEIFSRFITYMIMGLAIAFCSITLIKKKLDVKEILILAVSAASTYAIVDQWLPRIRTSLDQGAGLGLGLGLVL